MSDRTDEAERVPSPFAHLDYIVTPGRGRPRGSWVYYLDYLLGAIDFDGRTVLDIGGGDGVISFYAAARGARRVVCLEPGADGSMPGVIKQFRRIADALRLTAVTLQAATFQNFRAADEKFDIVILHNSVNHLDETACINLRTDPEAARRYDELFAKLAMVTAAGGTVILADCSSENLFATLGMRNPFAPTIEWHKHQPPRIWREMLLRRGFEKPSVRWTSFSVLGAVGRLLMGNAAAGYLTTSHFVMTLRKAR
jgi:SAM-dependent methyltransferase